MKRFIEGQPRNQSMLFPEHLDDWIAEDNPVRAVDAFVEELDLRKLGFESAEPAPTGRQAYRPATRAAGSSGSTAASRNEAATRAL
jgi:transposase